MTQFAELLKVLAGNGVEFVLVGGAAAAAHGSVRGTQDVDVVYSRDAGGGTYESLHPHSEEIEVRGVPCRVLGIAALIRAKRAAGRPRDLEAIAEQEAIRDRQVRGRS